MQARIQNECKDGQNHSSVKCIIAPNFGGQINCSTKRGGKMTEKENPKERYGENLKRERGKEMTKHAMNSECKRAGTKAGEKDSEID